MATITPTPQPLALDVERPPLPCCQAPFLALGRGTTRVAHHRPGCYVALQRAFDRE